MTKLDFPKEYIKLGDIPLNSGMRSNFKCEVEELLLNDFHFDYVLNMMPFAFHYVGIATGGAFMAHSAWRRNPKESRISYIKNGFLVGSLPETDYMMVDDVVTTGGSLERAINLIGKKPDKIVVAVDRREKKARISGVEIISLYNPINPLDFEP